VSNVISCQTLNGRTSNSYDTVQHVLASTIFPEATAARRTLSEILIHAFNGDWLADGLEPPRLHLPTSQEIIRSLLEYYLHLIKSGAIDDLESLFNSYEKLPKMSASSKYIRRTRAMIERRRLLKTEEGSIGLGPGKQRPGDKLYVTLGCYSPSIFRQTVNKSRVVIGEGYSHNVANGETLLGSLPKTLRPIFCLHPSDGHTFSYVDLRTGVIQVEDP
jgi:hypothetical protein